MRHRLFHTNWLSSPGAGEHRQGPSCVWPTAVWHTSALGIKHSAVPKPYGSLYSPCCSLQTDLHILSISVLKLACCVVVDLTLKQTQAFYYVLQAKVLFYWRCNNSSKFKLLTLDSSYAWCLDLRMTPISKTKALFRLKICEQTLI